MILRTVWGLLARSWECFALLLIFATGAFVPLAGAKENPSIALSPLRSEIYHQGWIDHNKNGAKEPFEDSQVDIDKRIANLLSLMTVDEKTCQLATLYGYGRVAKDALPTPEWKTEIWRDGIANIDEHINGVFGRYYREDTECSHVWPPSSHSRAINEVQRWFVEETRLGIPVDFTNEGIRGLCHRKATNFPAQVGVGASWDVGLVSEIGKVTGREAKLLGYTQIYSPIVDLARDPRWGRVVECYGEDPYLVTRLGVAQAQGLMSEGVGSTAKHFAVYSAPKGGRDGEARTDPHVAAREMLQMYLMPFEALIREADITGVMSSYNDYDGVPVSGSKAMLIDELRTRLGFQGYVVSDSHAVAQIWKKHRVASSRKEAVRQYLAAGGNVRTDFDMPQVFIEPVRELIAEGALPMSVVDERVADVLRVKFRLGLFDEPYVKDLEKADREVHCESHRQVALRAARESLVLLKNEKQTLPLSKSLGAILVCGPNAKEIAHSQSRYGPSLGNVISVLEGIEAAVSPQTKVVFAKGCEIADARWPESDILYEPPAGEEASQIEEAVAKAKDVDAIVVVLGESAQTIGESVSRTALTLTGHQRELVKQLHATGKPVVVVLVSGRALAINWIDRHVPAILEAWFPGEWCGQAVAEALFGDINPGGKLPVTFPRTVGQVPYNFPHKPGSQAGQGKEDDPNGVGNSRVYGALYPFGFGLSYTTFEYDALEISPREIRTDGTVTVSCRVTNVGKVAGDEVVQLYLRDDVASVVTYDKQLRGFDRVTLAPGESKTVSFRIEPRGMELLNRKMERVVEPGRFTVELASNSEEARLEGSFEVVE